MPPSAAHRGLTTDDQVDAAVYGADLGAPAVPVVVLPTVGTVPFTSSRRPAPADLATAY